MNANTSKIIRRTHMYLALFITPWMIIYSLSGLVLNHFPLVRSWYGGTFGQFEKVEERKYTAAFSADADAKAVAAQILEQLGMTGAFNVQGGPDAPRMVINRPTAFYAHRITWTRAENKLLIEKQTFNAAMFVNRSHFRHGYEQPFLSSKLWAITVDLAVIGMLFWVASGIWMWWEIKPARIWGAVFGAAGLAAFGILFMTI
jgi:hypothetical protein